MFITNTYRFAADEVPFDPLTYDGNVLALWDGDVDLSNTHWIDRVASYDLVLYGTPLLDAPPTASNGHHTVRFRNYTTDHGQITTPVFSAPWTQYIVYLGNYDGNRYIMTDGIAESEFKMTYRGGTPKIGTVAGAIGPIYTDPDLPNATWGILTTVNNGSTPGSPSQMRTNNSVAAQGQLNIASTRSGITIGTNVAGFASSASTSFFAYIILRQGADSTAVQDLYINWLMERFAIT